MKILERLGVDRGSRKGGNRRLFFVPITHEEGDTPDIVREVTDLSSDLRDVLSERVKNVWPKLIQGKERLVDDPSKTKLFLEAAMDTKWLIGVQRRYGGPEYSDEEAKRNMVKVLSDGRDRKFFATEDNKLVLYLLLRGVGVEVTEDRQTYGQRHAAIHENMQAIKRFYVEGADNFTQYTPEELARIDRSFQMIDKAMSDTDGLVASQINTRLGDGETGILIFGSAHFRILDNLAPDIRVDYLNREVKRLVEAERRAMPVSLGEKMRRDFSVWQEGRNAERGREHKG